MSTITPPSEVTRPELTGLARSLPQTVPFVGPEALERRNAMSFVARIGANENGFGPSPKAMAAMRDSVGEIWKYTDPENHDLIATIAAHYGVGHENVVVGEGADGLLGYAARLYVEAGVPVVTSIGGYPTFNYHVNGYGGVLHGVPYDNDHENPDGLIAMAQKTGARLIYLANPDNPMGSWWPGETIERMIAKLPQGTMLLLDEAYIEAAPAGTAPPIDVTQKNVLRFRTFSKAYGMAGARVGYVLGEAENIAAFEKIRNHFGMNRSASIGAIAAMEDQQYLGLVVERIVAARDRIAAIAKKHGLVPLPSATNFVAIDCQRDSDFARKILTGLGKRGIFVRMPGVEPLSRCIRVSCGPDDVLDLFDSALGEVLAELA